MNTSSSLSFCIRNLHMAGIAATSRGARAATDTDPYSLLYKGLAEGERSKNDCHIVLKNISDKAIEISEAFTVELSWSRLLNNSAAEQAIQMSDLQATAQSQSQWSIKWISSRRVRFWQLTAKEAIRLNPGSELAFLAQNIKAEGALTSNNDDSSHLTFTCKQSPESSSPDLSSYAAPVSLKRLDVSQDQETLPIDAAFTAPKYPEGPNAWNVRQNQLQLFHPSKRDNEVYCNTIKALIESRLGFCIRNPSGSSLQPKSATADPRFVVTMAYGNNVRALSRREDYLPFEKAIQFNGSTDYIEVPAHTNPTHAITVAIWAKNANELWGSWGGQLICKRDAFILHGTKNSKRLECYIFLSDVGWKSVSFTPPESFSLRDWHHYALTYDGNDLVLYIDASECAKLSCVGTLANPNVSMYFAKDPAAGENGYLNGQLAMASLLAKACSEGELQQLMDNQWDGFVNDVVGSYPLNLLNLDETEPKVLDLSANQFHGVVRGHPTITQVSANRPGHNSGYFQGVKLTLDGMDNNSQPIDDLTGIAFTQTETNSAGIKTWTLRPLDKTTVLESRHRLRVVFDGICPDNTPGEALITIAYYDIKGYKDGYTTLLATKSKPTPYKISPQQTLDLDLLNPYAGLELNLQFFGLDKVSLYRTSNGQKLVQPDDYPAVLRDYKLTFNDNQLWQDQELMAEYSTQAGETTTFKLANIRYKGAFGVEWRKKIYHSNWVQLQQPIHAINSVDVYYTQGPVQKTVIVADSPPKYDAGVNRYSLQFEQGMWKLVLEVIQARWWQPSERLFTSTNGISWYQYPPSTRPGRYVRNKKGGGYFLLENIRFDDSGAAQFTIKNMEIYTRTGLRRIDLEGSVRNVNGKPVLDSIFLRRLSTQDGWECDSYCSYSFDYPVVNGINRPRPLREYSYSKSDDADHSSLRKEEYGSQDLAQKAADHVYGGYDFFYKDGVLIESTELCYMYPDNDLPPPANIRSERTLEHQDWQSESRLNRDLSTMTLDQANFDAVDLQGSNLAFASFVNASMQGAKLVQVDGTSAKFCGANLVEAQLNYGKFEQAIFDDANLTDASFLGANLTDARFIGANLTGTSFDAALLDGAQFGMNSGLSEDQLQTLRLRGAVIID
ncbi:MAG: LamG-like jellyroll fold domain-containing protein [Cyanobacteriota bacterium]